MQSGNSAINSPFKTLHPPNAYFLTVFLLFRVDFANFSLKFELSNASVVFSTFRSWLVLKKKKTVFNPLSVRCFVKVK